MSQRVPPSVQTGQKIRELIAGGGEDVTSRFVRLAVEQVIEHLLEAEVTDVLGRDYYRHHDDAEQPSPRQGYRNGHRTAKLASAEGAIEYSVPQVCDTDQPHRSQVRAALDGRSEELERLATEMYARGLSVRDIEDALRDGEGWTVLSRTAVSQVTERLWQEYEAFATRDLSDLSIVYLYLDGVAERLRPGQRREAVLCAWGIDLQGRKHLLHLSPGTKEDTACVSEFLQDLKRRGLRDPLLATTDGAGGLIRAVEEVLPRSERQRCLAHKMRNLQGKVPDEQWPEFRAAAVASYQAPSPAMARLLRDDVVKRYEKTLPGATACFLDDFAPGSRLHRTPALSAGASQGHIRGPHHEPARTTLRAGASPHQGHASRLRRTRLDQDHVRRHHPRLGPLARHQGHPLRTTTTGDDQTRTGPGVPTTSRLGHDRLNPFTNFQQNWDLTRRRRGRDVAVRSLGGRAGDRAFA